MAEASKGREAVEQAKRLKPDVAVLDIGMPSLNGLEAARQMLKNDPSIKIVILTMHDSDNLVREVIKVGARGCVSKTDAIRDLVAAISAVRSGVTFFTAKVAEVLFEGVDESRATDNRLTPRQREIIQLLAEGQSSKEIGARAQCQNR
jgi:DNA-binding NarL/FixJ family response regulator